MSVQVTVINTSITVTITNQSVSPETSIVSTVTAPNTINVSVMEGTRFGPGVIQRPGIGSSPNFLNSWTNFGGTNENFGYTINAAGFVILFGAIKPGSSTTFYTLPVGYRPLHTHLFRVSSSTGSMEIQVNSGGTLICNNLTSLTYLSLDGIQFLQEQ